jgi:SNF2 family DNA or RNA helicase
MKHFRDVYSTPIDRFQDKKRAEELQKLISPFILRRTKKQVATELPEKTEMVLYCEMGTEQRKVYEAYRREFELYLEKASQEELTNNSMHVLQGLTKLRQICNSPELLSDQVSYGDESVKLDELMEQIDNLKKDHKILIFSQFVEMLNLIRTRLEKATIGYSYLTGQSRNRQEIVEEFQNDEEKRVFLISLKAGGTGLNLTEADYVFIVDPWWNPAVENQAIDRAYRIGQKQHVTAIRMICKDSIEEKILTLQEGKKSLAEDLIRVDRKEGKSISKQDLLSLIG